MSDLYETDILEWSDRQAALLRRVAAGEAPNEPPDWANIIDEVESVGRSELRACESHLVMALLHDLKCEAWPRSTEVPHWRGEARRQRDEARAAFTSAMRRRVDVAALYRRALNALPTTIDGQPPLPVPPTCPVSLDDLLGDPSPPRG